MALTQKVILVDADEMELWRLKHPKASFSKWVRTQIKADVNQELQEEAWEEIAIKQEHRTYEQKIHQKQLEKDLELVQQVKWYIDNKREHEIHPKTWEQFKESLARLKANLDAD